MTSYTVEVICGWCKCKMGWRSGFTQPDPTHGICPTCYEDQFPAAGGRAPLISSCSIAGAATPRDSTPAAPIYDDGTCSDYTDDGMDPAHSERADLIMSWIAVGTLACALFLLALLTTRAVFSVFGG